MEKLAKALRSLKNKPPAKAGGNLFFKTLEPLLLRIFEPKKKT